MKSYKLVNSEEVQGKANRLGYYAYNGMNEKITTFSTLISLERGCIYDQTQHTYTIMDCEEITQSDFLALPETIKVGDWVKFNGSSEKVLFKIQAITHNNTLLYPTESSRLIGYGIEGCTKLTPEQIKVLGLEDL